MITIPLFILPKNTNKNQITKEVVVDKIDMIKEFVDDDKSNLEQMTYLYAIVSNIFGVIKRFCPKKTGRLINSIVPVLSLYGNKMMVSIRMEDYGANIEFGTHKVSQKPFIRPALMLYRLYITGLGGVEIFSRSYLGR